MNDERQSQFEEAVRLGHEQENVHVARIVQVGAVLAFVVLIAIVLMAWLIGALERNQPVERSATALPATVRQPPSPRLDPDQPKELRKLRAREESVLSSYEWIDKDRTAARIPIERAMEILADDAESSREAGRSRGDEKP